MNVCRLLIATLILCGGSWILDDSSAEAWGSAPSSLRLPQSGLKDDHEQTPRHSLSELIRHQADQSAHDEPTERSSEDLDEQAEAAASRKRSTRAHLDRLKKPLSEITIRTAESGGPVPEDRAEMYSPVEPQVVITAIGASPPRPNRYTARFMHRPLYYEQPNLERCGRSCGYFQNPISGIQFLANTMVLPYHMGQEPACCPIPAGGDCRTCQSYPHNLNPLPLSCHGSVAEAATIAGFSFLLL